MNDTGRILLADDEATFLGATADLLRREGFDCETAPDGDTALALIADKPFDLLITDLEMPGNADLNVVRQIADQGLSLPVIILTGYPSVRTAVACVELPVAAYLTKPVEFELLLSKARASVSRFRSYQAMQKTEGRLRGWRDDFNHLLDARTPATGSSVDVFLALTLRNVMGSLTDLEQLSRALNHQSVSSNPCQLMNCPRGAQLHAAVQSTIAVLEETKSAFKSKTLGDHRHQLELMLQHL